MCERDGMLNVCLCACLQLSMFVHTYMEKVQLDDAEDEVCVRVSGARAGVRVWGV